MSNTIRELEHRDFFPWLDLYAGYADLLGTPLDDERALRVWSWLTDPGHPVEGLLAVDEEGAAIGLAHFHRFTRPLENDHGCFIDELYVAESSRQSGVGTALVEAVHERAAAQGCSVVRWLLTEESEAARALYDRLGTREPWETYQMPVRAS